MLGRLTLRHFRTSNRSSLFAEAWLLGLAGLLAVSLLLPRPAIAEDSSSSLAEITVLARDEARARVLLDDQASVEGLAQVSVLRIGVGRTGARGFALKESISECELRSVLARLRAHPDILYAERASDDNERRFARSLSVEIAGSPVDRLVIGPADPELRAAADRGEPLPGDLVRDFGRVAGVPLYFERAVAGGFYALRFFHRLPPGTAAEVAQRLSADPQIDWAEPAVRGRFQSVVDEADPLLPAQWALHDPVAGISAPGAWQVTAGVPEIVLAVLDSGLLVDHPDFVGHVLPGRDFVWDALRARDLDGPDGDASDPGDFVVKSQCDDSSPAGSSSWHGSHVAGIAAASANGIGTVGVAPGVSLLPVRIGASCGIDPIDLAEAIRWAAGVGRAGTAVGGIVNKHPARIINLSLSFPGPCPPYLEDAVADALRSGALIIAAAGNEGRSAAGTFPGNCPGVLAVFATDETGARASYSNHGAVDLAAPGGSVSDQPDRAILSAGDEGRERPLRRNWIVKQGTSMAAPHVAGVAALVLSVTPELTPGQLWNILIESARAFPQGTAADCSAVGPMSCGAGIVDASAAVQAAVARRDDPAF